MGSQRRFADSVVVITGAAGGIGRALGEAFAARGARVAALDVDAEGLAELERNPGAAAGRLLCVRCDLTLPADCEAAAERIRAEFGRVDVLVNNAGVVHRSSFRTTELAVFRRVMEVNYFGSLQITKALLEPLIEARGLVVVISSIAGLAPLYGRSGYSASKHALHGLFESMRSELADQGVGVLVVCPSFTRSEFERRALGAHGERVARGRSKLGSEASPELVAEAVVRAAERGQRRLVFSPVGKLSVWLSRFAPGLHARLMANRLASELEE